MSVQFTIVFDPEVKVRIHAGQVVWVSTIVNRFTVD